MTNLVKMLYGSRLYGTDTPGSDTDYKVVFLPEYKDVLLGRNINIKSKSTSSDDVKNNADDVDESFVPLQVFARDFFGGQTYALEMAYAIAGDKSAGVVEMIDDEFDRFVVEMVQRFSHDDVKAMVGYAWNQAQKYQLKGRRYKALSLFLDELEKATQPGWPVSFLFDEVGQDGVIKATSDDYETFMEVLYAVTPYIVWDSVEVNGKTLRTIRVLDKHILETVRIEELTTLIRRQLNLYGHRSTRAVEADVDWKSVYHAVRVAHQAVELLETGKMTVPYDEDICVMLKNIKLGHRDLEEVKVDLEYLVNKIDELKYSGSILPTKTPELEEEFEEFLFQKLKWWYRD